MSKKLYVGNLPFSVTEDAVREQFGQYGDIVSVKIITDQATGRSKGFGFIEMENADQAMTELNGKEFEGRPLKVNEARERRQGQSGGFRRNKRGGGGGGGGGGGRSRHGGGGGQRGGYGNNW